MVLGVCIIGEDKRSPQQRHHVDLFCDGTRTTKGLFVVSDRENKH